MNTEKTFKLILIFVLICGIIGCYTKKDIENFATNCNSDEKKITGSDGEFLCFPKSKDGAYNVNISNEGDLLDPPFRKIKGINCSPNCKSCGFSDDPTGESDCIHCKDNFHHYQEYDDGTGSCHEEKIGHDQCTEGEKEIYLDNYQKTKLCFDKNLEGAFHHNNKMFFEPIDPSGVRIKCDKSCKSCGFSDNPSGKKDCIICKEGYPVFTPEWPDGTGSCSKEKIGSEKTKAAKVPIAEQQRLQKEAAAEQQRLQKEAAAEQQRLQKEVLLKKINEKYEIIKKTVNKIKQLDPNNKIVINFNKRKKGFDTNIKRLKMKYIKKNIKLKTITGIYGMYVKLSEKMINEEKRLRTAATTEPAPSGCSMECLKHNKICPANQSNGSKMVRECCKRGDDIPNYVRKYINNWCAE